MSSEHPVQIDATSPPHFDRAQLLLRIGIAMLLGWLGFSAGWLVCLLFAALPLIAAISISSARDAYLKEIAPPIWSVLAWLLRLSAYMLLIVDRFPTDEEHSVVAEIRYTGRPTAGSALTRLVTSIPSGFVLMLLWRACQRSTPRWQARLVAYHASFVAEYPPWALDTEPSSGAALAMAGGR